MSTSGFQEWLSEVAFMLLVALSAIVAAPFEVASLVFRGVPEGPEAAVVEARGDGVVLVAACLDGVQSGLLVSADPDDRSWADGWAASSYHDTIVWRIGSAPVRSRPWPQLRRVHGAVGVARRSYGP